MKAKKENSSMNINVRTKDLAIKTKRTFRGVASIALTSALVITGVVGISSPAYADNDKGTYIDENFNTDGFFIEDTSKNSIDIEGVFISTQDLTKRKIVVSVEDDKAVMRAYVPSTSVTDGWSGGGWKTNSFSKTPEYEYDLDTTFGTNGVLELTYANVTGVLVPKNTQIEQQADTNSEAKNELVPRMLVSTDDGNSKSHFYIGFENGELVDCDKNGEADCWDSARKVDITTQIEEVGGSGVQPTGFSSVRDNEDEILVSGINSSSLPFIAEINVDALSVSDVEISATELGAGYSAGDFIPINNGLRVNFPDVIHLAGNLEDGSSSVGAVFRRSQNLAAASVDPLVHVQVGSSDTKLEFMDDDLRLGGSYLDGTQRRPFIAATSNFDAGSSDSLAFSTTKLHVDSSSDETLLSTNFDEKDDRYTTAVGTDGGKLRVYSWETFDDSSGDIDPDHTEIVDFTTGTLSSAVVSQGYTNNLTRSGKLVFAAFERSGDSDISIARFQSRPLIPKVISAPTFGFADPWFEQNPSIVINDVAGNTEYAYFKCDDEYAGSSMTTSTPNPPTGCEKIDGADINNSGGARIGNGQNESLLVGNIVLRYTYSSPDFVYWSNSVLREGSGAATPPSITSVTPLRGGAQVNFNPGDTPGIASFRVEASAKGYDPRTATGTSSPITVDGLEDGVTYNFSLTAFDSNGVFAAADNTPESSPTLSPGSSDGNFFITPSVSVNEVAETVLAPSGNIYVISADVRRYLSDGSIDTDFGTSGIAPLPSPGPTVLDVVEADDGLLVLIDDAGTKKIVVYNDDGTVKTTVGNSGVLTPTQPSAPANPLDPKIDITGTEIGDGSSVGVEIPGVELPIGLNITPSAVRTVDLNGSPANYVLGETTDGPSGSGFLISRIIDDDGPVSDATFGEGPILIDNPSGTPEAGGVTVDDEGNVYVMVKVDNEVIIVAIEPDGSLIENFGDEGILTIAGADSPGSIEFKDNRLVVSSKTASATVLSAFLTPAGFDALPLAVGSSGNQQQSSPGGAAYSAPSPFAGPVVTGVTEGGISASAGGNVSIQGEKLESVSEAKIGELEVEVVSATATGLELKLPEGLEDGVYALTLTTAQGLVTIEDAIRVSASNAPTFRGDGQWTKAQTNAEGTVQSVKMYAKDPIGIGKMQFVVNGEEIAWIRAEDETDPKLREAVTGDNYLVRTIDLVPGKNALEIYIEGERVWRAAYTLR